MIFYEVYVSSSASNREILILTGEGIKTKWERFMRKQLTNNNAGVFRCENRFEQTSVLKWRMLKIKNKIFDKYVSVWLRL